MKKILSIILLVCSSYLLRAQTYPVEINVARASSQIGMNNAFKGKLIISGFADTTAANTEGYLKNYDGALIKTTTPINAVWYRYLAGQQWVQILPSGGSTGTLAWTMGGNNPVVTDGSGYGLIGPQTSNGLSAITNNLVRFSINTSGALGLGIGRDFGTSGQLIESAGSASAPTWTTYTWQKALTAGSTLNTDNVVNSSGYAFTLEDAKELNFASSGTTSYIQLSATNSTISSEIFVEHDSIRINPYLGKLTIDTLTNNVGTKALRYNHTTGLVSYADTTTGFLDSLSFNLGTLSEFNIAFSKVVKDVSSSKCKILLGPGDSNTDRPEVFNVRLRELLLNYGKVDPGWTGFNPDTYPTYGIVRGVTAGWTKHNRTSGGLSLNLDDIASNDNTQYIQIETTTFSIPHDSANIYFQKSLTSGSFSIQVDAGPIDTVSTTGAAGTDKYVVTGLSNASHLYTIRPVGDGEVKMLGAYLYSSDPSFVIAKVAQAGCASTDFANAPASWDYQIQDIMPDLIINNIGTNDESYNTPAADLETNLETIIDRERDNNEFVSIITLAPSDNGLSTTDPKIDYVASVINAAINKNTAFGSLYRFWGDYDNALDNGVFFDQVHYTYVFPQDGNISFIGGLMGIEKTNPIYTGGQVVLGSDATGDIWYRNASGNFTRLPIGTSSQGLRVVGGLPAWGDTAVSGSSLAIGSTVTSATAGSIFFAGTGGKFQEINSKLFYDSTNVRVGIGINSPTYEMHIEKTVNGSIGAAIVNQSGGASGAARIDVARSFGGDYYGSLYYAGDGNTIYTPVSFNLIASASTSALNINHTGNAPIGFLTQNTERMTILGGGNVGINNASPNSSLQVSGSFASKYNATATGITLDGTYGTVNVTATGQTITLPTAASITGRVYTIKLTASGSATVATTSSQTIDGATTYSLSAQYKYVSVQSDGANWMIISNN